MELTNKQKGVIHAYLMTFSTDFGKIVLEDIKKSYHDRTVEESKVGDHAYLVWREAQRSVYQKIVRLMGMAAEEIERREGIEPVQVEPEVITEGD